MKEDRVLLGLGYLCKAASYPKSTFAVSKIYLKSHSFVGIIQIRERSLRNSKQNSLVLVCSGIQGFKTRELSLNIFPNPDQKVRGMYKIFLSKAYQVGHRYIFQGMLQGTTGSTIASPQATKNLSFYLLSIFCPFLTSFLHPIL